MKSVADNIDKYLATAAEMLMAEGMTEAADLLRTTASKVEETGYDNWNGGTTIWTVYLAVEPTEYVALGPKRETLEDQIDTRLKAILERFTHDWFGVKITPKVEGRPDWRHAKGDLSREVRQNIIDGLRLENVRWSGRLEEVEFLQRLYDLNALPSTDSRFKDAAGDIWQHRVNNPLDWDDDWVYGDDRFSLLDGPTETFLRFLAETVHPVVRPDRNEVLKLVQHFNDQLQGDSWTSRRRREDRRQTTIYRQAHSSGRGAVHVSRSDRGRGARRRLDAKGNFAPRKLHRARSCTCDRNRQGAGRNVL